MQPEIDLGPITLQTFGLMMGLGFVVAGLAASRFLKEIGKPVDWAYEMVFAALVGGIVGARLWWVFENWSDAKDDVLGSLFSGSGLVWYGGAIGGAIGVLLWAWRRNFLTLQMFDVAAVPAVRTLSHLPIIVDPSHATGKPALIPACALAGLAAGADGVHIEVHNCPEKALSDGAQALRPEQYAEVARQMRKLAELLGKQYG